jgi:hypothetical protein
MRAVSTADVPWEVLRDLRVKLGRDFAVEVDENQIFLRSAEPPSWITFLAEGDWWLQALAAYAALYVAELVKEAAKDTWKNRAKALAVGVAARNSVKVLANAIANLRKRLQSRTRVELGLPYPDDYSCTRIELLETADPDELAIQIALFVHHLPRVIELMRSEPLDGAHVAAGITLEPLPDGSLEVRWQDNVS